MERLLPLIKGAAVNGLVAKASGREQRKMAAGAGMFVLAAGIFFLALIFAAVAAFGFLTLVYSQPVALSLVAAGLLVITGLLLLGGARMIKRGHQHVDIQARQEATRLVDMFSDDFLKELEEPIRDHPKTALAGALLAGFLAERLH